MLVKCRACGKKIDKQSAYTILHNNIKWYYCSKEEIDKIEAAKKVKDDIYNIICDIFGYKVQNTVLWKEIAIWKTLADDGKILEYLQENRDYIEKSMSRAKDSKEFGKIRYFSAILKNSIMDFKEDKRVEPQKIEVNCEMYEPAFSANKKHKGLSALEDEV